MEVPIMAMATTNHFDDLLARKKASLPDPFLLVSQEMSMSSAK
jgi:hypothetical protein